MYWFTADEHYGHKRILEYCNRPFINLDVMDSTIIFYHNKIVKKDDVVVHAGDFCFGDLKKAKAYIYQLNGSHIFLKGCHDHWMPERAKYIWTKTIEKLPITVCHYAMRRWKASHYNSWQLFGHSHGRLVLNSKQYDIGVDNNNFYPVSWEQIKEIMSHKPDNPDLIKEKDESRSKNNKRT